MRFAARIDRQLERYIVRLARDDTLSIAEVNRRAGERAEATGALRPSYSAIRELVILERPRWKEPSWGTLLLDVATRKSPPGVLEDKLVHNTSKHLPEDWGIRQPRRRTP